LISGGAGTVGRLAVQVAAASGARVIATAHGRQEIEAAKSASASTVWKTDAVNLPHVRPPSVGRLA
jgi:NADPH2:quinone reductase